MSTDYQRAREALGARLRELRTETGLTARQFAALCGWTAHSKVSKLETGRQTATGADLDSWAAAAGHPEVAASLRIQLQGLETQHQSVQRTLAAGYAPLQEATHLRHQQTATVRGYEATVIPGILQTADYARAVYTLNAELNGRTSADIEQAVRARMQRQAVLYEAGRRYQVLIWEAVLHELVCPAEVMAAQLDRLIGLLGLDTLALGVVPLGARLGSTLKHGFWIFDDQRVTVETVHASLWVDDPDHIALYGRAWSTLERSAAYRADAHRLIARARAALGPL